MIKRYGREWAVYVLLGLTIYTALNMSVGSQAALKAALG